MKKNIILMTFAVAFAACHSSQPFDATGNFEATELTLSSEANGRLLSFSVFEGEEVQAGQCLGLIDTMQLYLSKRQLQENIRAIACNRPQVGTQLAALLEQLRKQKVEQLRIKKLLAQEAATCKQLDDITSAITQLERQVNAQRQTLQNSVGSVDAQLQALEMQIAQLDDRLAKCRICSPIDGTLLRKYAEAGELTAAGKPLLKIADLSQMYLRAYVTSLQLAQLQLGQQVQVTAQFGGESQRTYQGILCWIASESEFTPKNIPTVDERADMVYAIKIRVANDGFLKIGTYGEVRF